MERLFQTVSRLFSAEPSPLRVTALENNEAILAQCLKEHPLLRCGGRSFHDDTSSDASSSIPRISPHLSHPLLDRFEDPVVEDAFSVFKANSSLNRVSLCLTLCLCALSIASVVVVDLFVDMWQEGGHSALSDIAVFTVIVLIYARRASRLLWARPFQFTPNQYGSRWSRPSLIKAFCDRHYVVLLLFMVIPVEASLGQPTLLSLLLVTSCIFVLVASSLLVAHAVTYCFVACLLYVCWLVRSATTGPEVDSTGMPLISLACCLILGLFVVYYLARLEEMLLREHFKTQYLAAYLYQSALLEEAMTDRLLTSSLPSAVLQYALGKRDTNLKAHLKGPLQLLEQHQHAMPPSFSSSHAAMAFPSISSPPTNRISPTVDSSGSDSHMRAGGGVGRNSNSSSRSNSYLIAGGWTRRRSDGILTQAPLKKQGQWVYPQKKALERILARYGYRTPACQHPFRNLSAGRFVQRKFCTVLVAKAVQGSHIHVPPEILFQAFAEFDLVGSHHRVSKICNTGSTYTASCGLFETWGSARRDALASVAMASDLVAIAEALGLDLCIGVASGSVVGTLDPVSYSFYDLVGDVVSLATIMAELGKSGQIFLGDSTYQLLDNYSVPRIITHNVLVRLLNGPQETVRALSNPYASSWWFEHRRQTVLKAINRCHEGDVKGPIYSCGKAEPTVHSMAAGGRSLSMDDRLWEVHEMEEGQSGQFSGRSIEVEETRKEASSDQVLHGCQTLTIPDIFRIRESLEGKQDIKALAQRLPTQLTTLREKESWPRISTPSSVGPSSLPLTNPSPDQLSCPWKALLWSSSNSAVIDFRNAWSRPRMELELIGLSLAVCALLWSRTEPISFHVLIALIPLQCYMRWAKRLPNLVLVLYYLLAVVAIASLRLGPLVSGLTALRTMFLISPALHLPLPQAIVLVFGVWALVLSSRAAFVIIVFDASSIKLRFLIERNVWIAVMMGTLMILKRQIEILSASLPLLVYPRVTQIKGIAHALRRRTDEVILNLIPSHVDMNKLISCSKLERSPYLFLDTQAVILHVDLRSLSKLDGLISPQQFCAFQKKLLAMLEGAVRLFSASRLWHSDQMYVAACGLGPDLASSAKCSSSSSSSSNQVDGKMGRETKDPVLHALGLSRFIKIKIHDFNLKNRVSLAVRIGIARGPITLSCMGTERFDATGEAIAVAKQLALRTKGVMVTADIADYLKAHAHLQILKTMAYHPCTDPIHVGDRKVEAVEVTVESQMPDHLMAGPRLDDFEVLGLLGSGGYGSVHLAKDIHTEGLFALKVMMKRRRGVSDLMRVELNVLAQVQHPHVVRFHYCLQTKSRIVLVMDYIRGGTLKSILKEQKPDPHILKIWVAQLVLALEYLHSLNIIHRDIKPDNCMVGEDGHLKLTDFGLAKVLKPDLSDKTDRSLSTATSVDCSDFVPLMQCLMPQRSSSVPSTNDDDGSTGSAALMTQPFRVLVVEDEPFTRLITKAMLKSMGFQPIMAPDGKQALEILRSATRANPIELVLLDLELPIMSGPEVLAAMQADVNLRYVPVVVLSVDDRTADMAACMKLGAKDYFVKPIRMDMASHLIKFAGDRRRELVSAFDLQRLSEGEHENEADDHYAVGSEVEDEDDVALDMLGVEAPSMIDKDWGFEGAMVDDDLCASTREHYSLVGTPYYMSPEMLDRVKYGRAVDYWALGVLIFECFAGGPPFTGEKPNAVFAAIRANKINWSRFRKQPGVDEHLESLVRGLLHPDQRHRLGAGLGGIEAIKRHPYFAEIDWDRISTLDIGFEPKARSEIRQIEKPSTARATDTGKGVTAKKSSVLSALLGGGSSAKTTAVKNETLTEEAAGAGAAADGALRDQKASSTTDISSQNPLTRINQLGKDERDKRERTGSSSSSGGGHSTTRDGTRGGGALNMIINRTLSFKSGSRRSSSRSRSSGGSSSGGNYRSMRRSRRAFNRDRWIALLESSTGGGGGAAAPGGAAAATGYKQNVLRGGPISDSTEPSVCDSKSTVDGERRHVFGGSLAENYGDGEQQIDSEISISQGNHEHSYASFDNGSTGPMDSSRGWGRIQRQFSAS